MDVSLSPDCAHDTREDFLQSLGSGLGFWFPTVQTVLKIEEGLSDWIRIRDSSRIDESDISDTPALCRQPQPQKDLP